MGVGRRPNEGPDGKRTLRVDVPPTDESSILLDFSNGVILTPGYCARCGSQTDAERCDVCGFHN